MSSSRVSVVVGVVAVFSFSAINRCTLVFWFHLYVYLCALSKCLSFSLSHSFFTYTFHSIVSPRFVACATLDLLHTYTLYSTMTSICFSRTYTKLSLYVSRFCVHTVNEQRPICFICACVRLCDSLSNKQTIEFNLT